MSKNFQYIPCRYSKKEYENRLFENEIGVDINPTEGHQIQLFTSKKYIHPIDDHSAYLTVELLRTYENTVAVGLPGADLLSGCSVTYVPHNVIRKNI